MNEYINIYTIYGRRMRVLKGLYLDYNVLCATNISSAWSLLILKETDILFFLRLQNKSPRPRAGRKAAETLASSQSRTLAGDFLLLAADISQFTLRRAEICCSVFGECSFPQSDNLHLLVINDLTRDWWQPFVGTSTRL